MDQVDERYEWPEWTDCMGQKFKQGDFVLFPRVNKDKKTLGMSIGEVVALRKFTNKGLPYRNLHKGNIPVGLIVKPVFQKDINIIPDQQPSRKIRVSGVKHLLLRNFSKVVKISASMVEEILQINKEIIDMEEEYLRKAKEKMNLPKDSLPKLYSDLYGQQVIQKMNPQPVVSSLNPIPFGLPFIDDVIVF